MAKPKRSSDTDHGDTTGIVVTKATADDVLMLLGVYGKTDEQKRASIQRAVGMGILHEWEIDLLRKAGLTEEAMAASAGATAEGVAEFAASVPEDNAGRFKALVIPEGEWTDDFRYIEPGALSWRELPIPLMALKKTTDGHDQAEIAGAIIAIYREGNDVMAEGYYDSGEWGSEIVRLVGDGTLRGISADLAIEEYEIEEPNYDEETGMPDGPTKYKVLGGKIMGATVVPMPAFERASIANVLDTSLTAGAALRTVPSEWFSNPLLEDLTPITCDEQGRVFGHLAPWNSCHVGIQDSCTTAPRSKSGYAHFMTGTFVCGDGTEVAVGPIVMDCEHVPTSLSATAAKRMIDNTGSAVADVVVGEDEFGIWMAGAMRDVDEDTIKRFRAGGKVSGSWWSVDGNLELLGIQAVNVPGFPIARARMIASADGGQEVASLQMLSPGARVISEVDRLSEEVARYKTKERLEGLFGRVLGDGA